MARANLPRHGMRLLLFPLLDPRVPIRTETALDDDSNTHKLTHSVTQSDSQLVGHTTPITTDWLATFKTYRALHSIHFTGINTYLHLHKPFEYIPLIAFAFRLVIPSTNSAFTNAFIGIYPHKIKSHLVRPRCRTKSIYQQWMSERKWCENRVYKMKSGSHRKIQPPTRLNLRHVSLSMFAQPVNRQCSGTKISGRPKRQRKTHRTDSKNLIVVDCNVTLKSFNV